MSKLEGVSKAFSLINKAKSPISKIIPVSVLEELDSVAEKFEINTPIRVAHFLAQCAHESNEFKSKVEKLNYSENGLKAVFKRYFPDNLAARYARKPVAIGSRVYANRMGNGDEASKEGFTYRGRGFIQLTGKNNYKAFGDSIGVNLVSQPDLVSEEYPLLSAAWYFHENELHILSDRGATDAVVKQITKRVNGGYRALDDRIALFHKIYSLL